MTRSLMLCAIVGWFCFAVTQCKLISARQDFNQLHEINEGLIAEHQKLMKASGELIVESNRSERWMKLCLAELRNK